MFIKNGKHFYKGDMRHPAKKEILSIPKSFMLGCFGV